MSKNQKRFHAILRLYAIADSVPSLRMRCNAAADKLEARIHAEARTRRYTQR